MPYNGKVTVLIPAFYHRANVVRCLDAWRRQTRKPDQLIVINDGGNGDLELLPGEQLIESREGNPLWRTINTAVRQAWPLVEHDYIVICSCDLIFTSRAIEDMLLTQIGDQRCTATVYCLNRETSAKIDQVDWKGTECGIFHDNVGFSGWPNTFKGVNSESPAWKAHILFTSNTRSGWERFDKLAFPANEGVGSDECWLRQVEVDAGREIVTLPYAVYHQWHPIRQRWNDCYDPTCELPFGPEQVASEEPMGEMSERMKRIAMKGMRENYSDQ